MQRYRRTEIRLGGRLFRPVRENSAHAIFIGGRQAWPQIIRLNDLGLSANEVDDLLRQLAVDNVSNRTIYIDDNNTARTSNSDTYVDTLVTNNNILYVNQTNSETTIVGTDSAATTDFAGNNVQLTQFTSSAAGYPISFDVYPRLNGNFKWAVYTDDGGEPDELVIGDNNATAVTSGQWNRVTLSSYEIEDSTVYWLGGAGSNADVNGQVAAPGGVMRYQNLADFSAWTWPDPAGGGWSGFPDRHNTFRIRV
jgi:hypothetical protein